VRRAFPADRLDVCDGRDFALALIADGDKRREGLRLSPARSGLACGGSSVEQFLERRQSGAVVASVAHPHVVQSGQFEERAEIPVKDAGGAPGV